MFIDPIFVMDLVNAQTYQMRPFVQACLTVFHILFLMLLHLLFHFIEVVFLLYCFVMVFQTVGILLMNKIVETFKREINFVQLFLFGLFLSV